MKLGHNYEDWKLISDSFVIFRVAYNTIFSFLAHDVYYFWLFHCKPSKEWKTTNSS